MFTDVEEALAALDDAARITREQAAAGTITLATATAVLAAQQVYREAIEAAGPVAA